MKVIMISTDRKIFEEGSAVRARMIEYAPLFDELDVIVFCRRDLKAKSFQIAANCRIYPTNSWSRWFYVRDAVRLGKKIAKNSAIKIARAGNNTVVSGQDPFECGLAAARLARRLNARLHIQIHTDFLNHYFARLSFLNRLRVHIARQVLPKADAIRVVSNRIASSLLKAKSYKLKASPVVLPIFTDIEKFSEAVPAVDLKKKYPHWDFIMLAVGRLAKEKSFDSALDVLRKVRGRYPKVGLVIVGSGPEAIRLKSKARRLGLAGFVSFEPWQSDLPSYYKTANLLLCTSRYEGFGLVLLEAAACGLPAVSTDVGIAPDLLVHKGHSFVCPVGDSACLAQKVIGLIEDNQLRAFFASQITSYAVSPWRMSKEEYLRRYKVMFEAAFAINDNHVQ
ncbi:glycosyltransferase [Patescibacteria group bacterium]|nr:glycosyltransferase [Patescibacteria group bacterium]